MIRLSTLFCMVMIQLCCTAENAYARRGFPIPIFFGYGEEMVDIVELPSNVAPVVEAELGRAVKVAFVYERAHLFWLDLWTWNGRHVLHSGDQYWEPDSNVWRKLIGGAPSARYGSPMLYRIPVLPALLALGIAGYAFRKRFLNSGRDQLDVLMNDSRYRQSVATIFRRGDDGRLVTVIDEQRFLVAKDQLISHGIDPRSAEVNLRTISDTILAKTNSQIDDSFAVASNYDQQGELRSSSLIYSKLISTLPTDDERLAYAKTCLASIDERLRANVGKNE